MQLRRNKSGRILSFSTGQRLRRLITEGVGRVSIPGLDVIDGLGQGPAVRLWEKQGQQAAEYRHRPEDYRSQPRLDVVLPNR